MSSDANRTSTSFSEISKVDLHRHLTGSIDAATAIRIAKAHGATLPSYDVNVLDNILFGPTRVKNLREFFVPWTILENLFVSLAAVKDIALSIIEAAAHDHVAYVEIRTGPRGILGESPFSFQEFVRELAQAVDEGGSRYGIFPRFVLGLPRHTFAPLASNHRNRLFREIIDTIVDHYPACFVGVDLSGDEELFGAEGFLEFFRLAAQTNLGIAVHAGEMGPPSNVKYAVEILGAKRIGHGLAAAKDPTTLSALAAAECAVEISPSSNYLLSLISRIEELPLETFIEWNIPFVICTDNPARCKTSMTKELALVAEAFNFSLGQIRELTRRAVHHSFGSEDTRLAVLEAI